MGIFRKGVEHWIKKGEKYADSDEFEKAIECFDKALEIDPQNATAWSDKGIVYSKFLGDLKRGTECFDKCLEINPNHVLAWHNKGYALAQSKKYGEALECLDKALEIHPYFLKTLSLKSDVYTKLGEYQKALDCINQLLAINPLIATKDKAEVLEKLGKIEEAKYWHERVTNKGKPGEAHELDFRASMQSNHQKAIDYFNEALRLDPKNAAIWSNKAGRHLLLGEHGGVKGQ